MSSAIHLPSAAPQLAYGRHNGPHPPWARRAAVAILLVEHQNRCMIPMTRRPAHLRHHGGQICFPGGQIESGESDEDAAIRELGEELGSVPESYQVLYRLPELYVYASNNIVFPIVFRTRETMTYRPDPSEVDLVIELPMAHARSSEHWELRTVTRPVTAGDTVVDHLTFPCHGLMYADHFIWGATAIMLQMLTTTYGDQSGVSK